MRVGALLPALTAVVALGPMAGCGGEDSSSESAGAKAGTTAKAEAGGSENSNSDKDSKQGPGVAQSDGGPEPDIGPSQRRKAIPININLASPDFTSGASLPATYTCDGENSPPSFRWSGLPKDAAELILLVPSLLPVDERLFFGWAVGGIDPSLSSLDAGQLPAGAVLGENGFGKQGYSICPPNGSKESYLFMLYATPKALDLKPGFDPMSAREAVVEQGGEVGVISATYSRN